MEDAHIACPDLAAVVDTAILPQSLAKKISIFGVFDGHGGIF
jgi:serine/threonine protein phosphatase PrpC